MFFYLWKSYTDLLLSLSSCGGWHPEPEWCDTDSWLLGLRLLAHYSHSFSSVTHTLLCSIITDVTSSSSSSSSQQCSKTLLTIIIFLRDLPPSVTPHDPSLSLTDSYVPSQMSLLLETHWVAECWWYPPQNERLLYMKIFCSWSDWRSYHAASSSSSSTFDFSPMSPLLPALTL